MKYYVYDLYTYDVWGNKKDGYEVNNIFLEEKDIVISEDSLETDKKLIQALKRLNLIDKKIQFKSLQIEGENEYILYFTDVRREAGYCKPAFEMRCTKVYGETKITLKRKDKTMKEDTNYWIDEHNNKWNKNKYTKEQAVKWSKTLTNCTDCTDCRYCTDCTDCTNCTDCRYCTNCTDCINCINCINCTDCRYCTDCTNCTDCRYCTNCTNCTDCRYCTDCTDCRYCTNCRYCTDCTDCTNCRYCTDFNENPNRYMGNKIGSLEEQTITYWTNEKNQVVCGCFTGTLIEFENRVNEVYKDNNEIFYNEYIGYINIVKTIMEMENKK